MVVRSIGWNWMATFCRIHFVRGNMVVCMDVTSTEVCALYASSSKTPQDHPSSNEHALVLQLYRRWMGGFGVGVSNNVHKTNTTPTWLYRSFSINVWWEFIYTRVGCWTYLIWRLVFSANWHVYLMYTKCGWVFSLQPTVLCSTICYRAFRRLSRS